MKHVAALMLLKLGGNSSPSQEDIGKLLDVIGDSSDETCLQRLFDGIGDRNVDDLVKEGRDKLCIVGGGSGGGAAPAAAGGDAAAGGAAAAEEPEEEEEEESSAAAGGMFGGSSSGSDSDSDEDSS